MDYKDEDNKIMQMIEPTLQEIYKKFNNSIDLTHKEINILLLKLVNDRTKRVCDKLDIKTSNQKNNTN